MCGIVGYVGFRQAVSVLLAGMRKLEYRGYDSSGIATIAPDGRLSITKAPGRIADLATRLEQAPLVGRIGIGHTRWATHGPATAENAHPHMGGNDIVALVHNGVIENIGPLKERLLARGYRFRSQTDSEVIAHLLADCLERCGADPGAGLRPNCEHQRHLSAIQSALAQLPGSYALAFLFAGAPDVLFAARHVSPLIIGAGNGEHFVASDAAVLSSFAANVVDLDDGQVAMLTAKTLRVIDRQRGEVACRSRAPIRTEDTAGLDGYAHLMLKEIFEQPAVLENTIRGRLDEDIASARFAGLAFTTGHMRRVKRILMTACGTSWHAALVGKYVIEELAKLPVEVEYASELRYRHSPLKQDTLVVALSQSGETADTLAALRELKRRGHVTLAICNVVDSTITREADGAIYLHAGPEVGVASTKAFTAQCAVLVMLALHLGRLRCVGQRLGREIIAQLQRLPEVVHETLGCHNAVKQIAERFYRCANVLYLGRQQNFPVALEGALKLKEISYIHAEGYPAAEMKHGPIALVDRHTPSVFLLPQGPVYEKVLTNLEEIKARHGPVIAIVNQGDTRATQAADAVIEVPTVPEILQPIVNVIPLQLLAYEIAVLRGCDVDKPRNLAKSVTVE